MLRNLALGIIFGFLAVYGLGSCGMAHAGGYTAGWTCSHGYQNCNLVTGYIEGADAKIINVLPQEGSERDRAWVAFCKPTEERGDHGVIYYTYAHEGCEFGRTR